MGRITEPELILPALYLIANKPDISTSELISELKNVFNPTGEDAEILNGRSDSKFSQIVRNLVAHHTIDQAGLGYTTYEHRGRNGFFAITESGHEYLNNNSASLKYLFDNQFQYPDLVDGVRVIHEAVAKKRKILEFDEDAPVFEGRKKTASRVVSERSKVLRDAAIQYYTKGGHIRCVVCGFDFYSVYGEIGKGFIEIHHKKPLFQYEDEDTNLFLNEAIIRVAPLCSNCHRIIHRNRNSVLEVEDLIAILNG